MALKIQETRIYGGRADETIQIFTGNYLPEVDTGEVFNMHYSSRAPDKVHTVYKGETEA